MLIVGHSFTCVKTVNTTIYFEMEISESGLREGRKAKYVSISLKLLCLSVGGF